MYKNLIIFLILVSCISCNKKEKPLPPEIIIDITKQVPEDFSNVIWLHTDVSKWNQTTILSNIIIDRNLIHLNYDKANIWPAKAPLGGTANINANAWIFVYKNNNWYAGTWEWMRVGQITKLKSACEGGHIKHKDLSNWKPISGETYGFMVSGLARSTMRNVQERSNVVMVQWPNY